MKRQKTLKDCFELFIQGEMLDGENKYLCEKCSKRVDTLKRTCLRTLPNYLLVHLKRFEFDYDRMRHIKINEMCEFPDYLNVEPYTVEGLARKEAQLNGTYTEPKHPLQYYDYELVGIVVHMGTVDFGHYISLIKDPNDKSGQTWFEFNDSRVTPFDPAQIPNACYGGFEDVQEMDRTTGKPQTVKKPKTQNAYILVYRKLHPDQTFADMSSTSNQTSMSQKVPERILRSIWEENSKFLHEQHIFSSEYISFMWTISSMHRQPASQNTPSDLNLITPSSLLSEPDPFLSTIQLATKYLIFIYAHSKEKPLFYLWMAHLKNFYSKSIPVSQEKKKGNFFKINLLLPKKKKGMCLAVESILGRISLGTSNVSLLSCRWIPNRLR